MVDDQDGPAAEKRKRELKGDIDHKFVQFDDFPRAFGEGVEGLYVQPRGVVIGGLTADNYVGPALMDSSNRLDVVSSPYGIGQGTIRMVSGTFTKDAVGTTGAIVIVPGTDDIIYFMYGQVVIGAVHAGAASPLTAGITGDATTTSDLVQSHLQDATADVNEIFYFPGLGAAATAAQTTSGVYHSLQTAMPSASLVTADGGATAISSAPRYIVEYKTMADTETFLATLYFLSVYDTAVTVSAVAGTWT